MATKNISSLKAFLSLSHEDKQKQVIEMMELIQDKIPFIKGILAFLHHNEASDEFLQQNYEMIMSALATSKETAMKGNIKKISKMRKLEKKVEQADEEAAEEMLNSI